MYGIIKIKIIISMQKNKSVGLLKQATLISMQKNNSVALLKQATLTRNGTFSEENVCCLHC